MLCSEVEGKSPNTVVAYREMLEQFLEVARAKGFAHDVREITSEHIYQFLGWAQARGVSDFTQHRRHRKVRFLFVWLERLGVIEENPLKHIRNPKFTEKVINPPSHWRKSGAF